VGVVEIVYHAVKLVLKVLKHLLELGALTVSAAVFGGLLGQDEHLLKQRVYLIKKLEKLAVFALLGRRGPELVHVSGLL